MLCIVCFASSSKDCSDGSSSRCPVDEDEFSVTVVASVF